MREKVYTLDEIKALAVPIARRHGVAALYLYGAYARGEATPQSNLDFRIEKGNVRTLYQLNELQTDMENQFRKELDVLTTPMLKPETLASIREEEVLLYAQG